MSELLEKVISEVTHSQHAFCRFIVANETGKTGSHQYGFYIPKSVAREFMGISGQKGANVETTAEILWQNDFSTVSRFIYYGRGSRNEYRITQFGKNFPYLDDSHTGDLIVFLKTSEGQYKAFVLSRDEDIEGFFEYFNLSPDQTNTLINTSLLKENHMQDARRESMINDYLRGLTEFPATSEMALAARKIYGALHPSPLRATPYPSDRTLIKWIETEYEIFKRLEEHLYAPVYRRAFPDCQTLIEFSNSILNRRKSRAGKSLEHHLAAVFTEAGLKFSEQPVTEDNKKPDFLFPSASAYHNAAFPDSLLTFLGVKTTCKDRWRQILNEADRIPDKHLFTLQQGLSSNQLREMLHEHVRLVVPEPLLVAFPAAYRQEILSLHTFIDTVKEKQEHALKHHIMF